MKNPLNFIYIQPLYSELILFLAMQELYSQVESYLNDQLKSIKDVQQIGPSLISKGMSVALYGKN